MYGLVCGLWFFWFLVKTDNTAYQALVLVWLGCDKSLGLSLAWIHKGSLDQIDDFWARNRPILTIFWARKKVEVIMKISGARKLTFFDDFWGQKSGIRSLIVDKPAVVPGQDTWRLPFLGKLLALRGEHHYQCLDTTQLTEQIDTLCVN